MDALAQVLLYSLTAMCVVAMSGVSLAVLFVVWWYISDWVLLKKDSEAEPER